MTDRIQVIAVVGSLALLVIILEAIRKRRLREQYSLIWLVMAAAILLLALWRDLLHQLSSLMGIYYPPSALLSIGIGFVVLILISFSIVVSELSTKVTGLTQRLALMEWEIKALREQQSGRVNDAGSHQAVALIRDERTDLPR